MMKKIGVIGCGNMFRVLVEAAKSGKLKGEIVCAYDYQRERCEELGIPYMTVEKMLSNVDIVVEAASIQAVKEYGEIVLSAGKDFVVMSVGALLDDDLRKNLMKISRRTGARIIVPSGAIGGIDAIKALPEDAMIKIVTTKPSRTLGVDVKERKVIFSGNAKEAVEKFPRSMNVAALLSLASGKTVDVEVIADPNAERNTHRIICEGSFGKMEITVENVPSPYNPRTSYLACLSLIRVLNNLCEENTIILGV